MKEEAEESERALVRRTRLVEATPIPDLPEGVFGTVFRTRLAYLMNGNSPLRRSINIQELSDEIGISRPAIRKYLKSTDRREVTVPSAQVVCRIAHFFQTTPNFLLGFDEQPEQEEKMSAESDSYSALGLSQAAIDRLKALRTQAVRDGKAAELMTLLDRLICFYADEVTKLR